MAKRLQHKKPPDLHQVPIVVHGEPVGALSVDVERLAVALRRTSDYADVDVQPGRALKFAMAWLACRISTDVPIAVRVGQRESETLDEVSPGAPAVVDAREPSRVRENLRAAIGGFDVSMALLDPASKHLTDLARFDCLTAARCGTRARASSCRPGSSPARRTRRESKRATTYIVDGSAR